MDKELQLRMYSLSLYQLSNSQGCIQAGHSWVEYGRKCKDKDLYENWADNHKTVMVMNGGNCSILESKKCYIESLGFECVGFLEPDLYNKMTSFSFIASERVFDELQYPQNEISAKEDSLRNLLKKLRFHGGR